MSHSEKQLRKQHNSFVKHSLNASEYVEGEILKEVTPEFAGKWREFNKKYLELFGKGRLVEAEALKEKFKKENS